LSKHTHFQYSSHELIYKEHTSTHAEGTDPRGGFSERVGVGRHCAPLCVTLVAAKSGSICIAVVLVSVSGGAMVSAHEGIYIFIFIVPQVGQRRRWIIPLPKQYATRRFDFDSLYILTLSTLHMNAYMPILYFQYYSHERISTHLIHVTPIPLRWASAAVVLFAANAIRHAHL